MKTRIVYMTPDMKYHKNETDGSVRKIRLDADYGKLLTHPQFEFPYIRKFVDSADGWTEIDAQSDEEQDDEATESDYIDALSQLGVDVE